MQRSATTATNFIASCALRTGWLWTKTALCVIWISRSEAHRVSSKRSFTRSESNVRTVRPSYDSPRSKSTRLNAAKSFATTLFARNRWRTKSTTRWSPPKANSTFAMTSANRWLNLTNLDKKAITKTVSSFTRQLYQVVVKQQCRLALMTKESRLNRAILT